MEATVIGSLYWGKLAALIVLAVLAVVMVVVQLSRRRYSTVRRVVQAVVSVGAVVLLWASTGVRPSYLWMALLLIVGAGLGYPAGMLSRVYRDGERVAVRRAAFAPVLAAVAYILTGMTLLFGTSYLFAVSLLVLMFSAGLTAGSALAEMLAAAKLSSPGASGSSRDDSASEPGATAPATGPARPEPGG